MMSIIMSPLLQHYPKFLSEQSDSFSDSDCIVERPVADKQHIADNSADGVYCGEPRRHKHDAVRSVANASQPSYQAGTLFFGVFRSFCLSPFLSAEIFVYLNYIKRS